jgi:hypothetical protein
MFEVECGSTSQDPVEQRKHLSVGVRTSAEQDDAGTVGVLKRNEAWVVEIGSNDDPLLTSSHGQQLVVRRPSESEIDGVDRIMTGSPKMRPSVGRHRHVDQELQPVSSMISSSARLAA